MDYFDMILDMASGEGELNPTEAQSVLNGAERQLEQLKEQVSERLPDGEQPERPSAGEEVGQAESVPSGIPDDLQKPKSEFSSRKERADFYEAAREAGVDDPHAAWQALPDE